VLFWLCGFWRHLPPVPHAPMTAAEFKKKSQIRQFFVYFAIFCEIWVDLWLL
jgi:hypothetical protein